ncbi:MAG: type II toxin-antitoxin system VapB family antitoxin [Candidatus Acidiferrum sp.]
MSLNIKSPEAHKLALEIAHETGESLTATVIEALREKRDRLRRCRRRDKLVADLIAMGKRGAKLAPGPYADHADLLYDENGLPK